MLQCYDPKQLLVRPVGKGHVTAYVPPIDEFIITRVDLQPGETQELEAQASPSIILVTEGALQLSGKPIKVGATYFESASVTRSNPLTASVPKDAPGPAQLYRVFAKDSFVAK